MPDIKTSESWHVVYTMPKSEQKAYDLLLRCGITAFFPVQSVLKKWSDRIKRLEIPLFPNYVFVRVSPQRRYEVSATDGVVRYVSFESRPAVVPAGTIESLKIISGSEVKVDEDPFTRIGMPVMICEGPFAGLKGYLLKKNGRNRLQVRVDIIQRTVSVEIPANAAIPLTEAESEKIPSLR